MKVYASMKELEADRARLRQAVARQEERIGHDAEAAWDYTKDQLNPLHAVKRMVERSRNNTWLLLGLRVAGYIFKKKLQ